MSIFTENVDFYPTPKEVIEKMIEPYKKGISRETYILEPSAGSGNIADYLSSLKNGYCNAINPKIHCIESDLNMQSILRDKGYPLVGTDFLNHENSQAYDLIIMNPPFSSGEHHLMKAWDILDDGHICCLLNAETIKNPYTKVRETLINIIDANGTVEYLGNCFSKADRKTDVDVVLVRLEKKQDNSRFKIDFNLGYSKEDISLEEEDISQSSLAVNDRLGAYIRAYNKAKETFITFAKSYEVLKQATETFGSAHSYFDAENIIQDSLKSDNIKAKYNNFDNRITEIAWRKMVKIMGMDKFMTNKVNRDFEQFVREQSSMALTKENVLMLINTLANNSSNIMKQCCVDVFDHFTKHYKENRMISEGWKTNSSWKVNRKVILPYQLKTNSWSTNFSVETYSDIRDIDKVMCYLSAMNYDKLVNEGMDLEQCISRVRIGDNSLQLSQFFEFRCYKKGTLHLYFKDEKLWDIFNQVACENKNWIGDGK